MQKWGAQPQLPHLKHPLDLHPRLSYEHNQLGHSQNRRVCNRWWGWGNHWRCLPQLLPRTKCFLFSQVTCWSLLSFLIRRLTEMLLADMFNRITCFIATRESGPECECPESRSGFRCEVDPCSNFCLQHSTGCRCRWCNCAVVETSTLMGDNAMFVLPKSIPTNTANAVQ